MKRLLQYRPLARGILALCLLLAAGSVQAQTMKVDGIVRDAMTMEPIAAAQVKAQGRLQGTLTDEKGQFSFEIDALVKTLEVSHIGYRKVYVQLKPGMHHNLEVMLENAAALDPVVISSGAELVLEDETIHLYDYEFFEGQLMMIIYDRALHRSKLALVDARDSILDMEMCAEEPGKLARDCFGNVHAITKHWACQLFLDDGEIDYYTDSLASFERTVEPVLGNIGNHYYFDHRRFNNQILDYLAYDMAADKWIPFLHVQDKNKMHQLMDPLGIYMAVATSESQMMAISPEDWKKIGTIDPEFQFEQMAFFYPVDAPLRVIDGKVVVFDHLNGLIRTFEADGKAIAEVPIDYHKLPNWQRAIIVDQERGEAYALYEKHGYSSLRKIDLATGNEGEPVEFPKQFPRKIMVRDGVAYFMYKQGQYDDTNRLYRMRL